MSILVAEREIKEAYLVLMQITVESIWISHKHKISSNITI